MKQGDVLRYMIMHRYGGLYLDMDVECFTAADESLRDYTILLQGTGAEGMTNAVLASAVNNSFWLEVLQTCKDRANKPQFDFAIEATGPGVMAETIRRLFNIDPSSNYGYSGRELEVSCPDCNFLIAAAEDKYV